MAKKNTQTFTISRTFDAPRSLVWKVLTEPKRMEQWWDPKGFTGKVVKLQLRRDGICHYILKGQDGKEIWGKAVYREIRKPEGMVFTQSFSDEYGHITRHPLAPSWPRQMLSTYTLTEANGKTTFTVQWSPLNPSVVEIQAFATGHDSMKQGWDGNAGTAGCLSEVD